MIKTLGDGAGEVREREPTAAYPSEVEGDTSLALATAAQHTWVALLTLDNMCRIVSANPAASALASRDAADLVGRRFCTVFRTHPCSARPTDTCLFGRTFAGVERRQRPRWMTPEDEGVIQSFLCSVVPLGVMGPQSGTSAGALVTLAPRTHVDSAGLRDESVSSALHELRHAVTVQMVAIDELRAQAGTLSDAMQGIVRTLDSATIYLAACVDNLHYRRLFDQGDLSMRLQETQVLPLVQQIAWRVAPALQKRGQRVTLRVPPALSVWADPGALEHVIGNLVLNAHTYSVDGDEIIVAACLRQHSMVEVTVTDHGPGIPRSHRHRIFERGYRPTGTHGHQGSGLGLAIVQSLVTRQGGTVGVRGTRMGGAQFWVRLPIPPPGVSEE